MAGAQFVSESLKAIFHRPRPELVPHEVAVYSASMPSGHAMLAATAFFSIACAFSEAASFKKERAFVFGVAGVLTFLVGASRVYLGVHWPTDVIAGWLAGIGLAALATVVYPRA
jgi:undecaprenyl-diphosphatase